MPQVNRQWLMTARPEGLVSKEHFTFKESPVPGVEAGQFLVRNLYLSFDPTLRVWMREQDSYVPSMKIGDVMRCTSVGQVVQSRNDDYHVGDFVLGGFGWQDFCVSDGHDAIVPTRKLPANIPLTLPLSALGITGLTAYFGMTDVGGVGEGDIVVVSGAAGATGSVAGQVARLKGATVIGIAGGEEKCRWLVEQAKFDHAIDYKSDNVYQKLKEYCPDGIDCFFDNVGGEVLDIVLGQLAINARVVLCGAISDYNSQDGYGLQNYSNLIVQRATMRGFIILDYLHRADEAAAQLVQWISQGDLVYQEDIQHGLENAPDVFQRIFTGKNRGKQLLKVAEPPINIDK